jgi:hypothetical protein
MTNNNVDRILKKQYEAGKRIIRSSNASQELLKQLKKECPHVNEDDLIRLFPSVAAGTKMVDPAIIASAHNKEYNIIHPPPKQKIWFEHFLTNENRKLITPKEILKRKKLYTGLIKIISATEKKYDDKESISTAVMKRRITKYLQDNVKKK